MAPDCSCIVSFANSDGYSGARNDRLDKRLSRGGRAFIVDRIYALVFLCTSFFFGSFALC